MINLPALVPMVKQTQRANDRGRVKDRRSRDTQKDGAVVDTVPLEDIEFFETAIAALGNEE